MVLKLTASAARLREHTAESSLRRTTGTSTSAGVMHFQMRLIGLPDFEANEPGFDENGETGDHAGKVETSLLWALEPECVDTSRMPCDDRPGLHFAMGCTARKASRRTGQRMVEDEVSWLGRITRKMLTEYHSSNRGARKPLSFADIEKIWADKVLPRLNDFESMKELFDGQTEPPPSASQWRLNWTIPKIPV